MPNHVHGILKLTALKVVQDNLLPPESTNGTKSSSIGAIMQNFKSVSSRKLRQYASNPAEPIWQRNYYEHVIRNAEELAQIQNYICNNPLTWQEDKLRPDQ